MDAGSRGIYLVLHPTGGSNTLAIFDGVVTLDTTDIPVLIELDDAFVRMSAEGTEIGQWATEECDITQVADTTYSITAEEETLQFVPNQPTRFAAALNGGTASATAAAAVPLPPDPEPTGRTGELAEAQPPKPLTMGLFYALCVLTAALAVWALVRMIF